MSKFKVNGIDLRVPLLIIALLGGAAGASIGRGNLDVATGDVQSASSELVGTASVIDGDTLDVHGIRIRLDCIDAPESRQTCKADGRLEPCGRRAAFHLADQIGRRPASCSPQGTDRYGRTLAVCYQDGADLNAMMVRDGHAVAYAEALAADDSVSDEVWRRNRLVARLTVQRHRYLPELDTATRYEAWEDWTRRRGQMLWPDLTPEQ